MSRDGLYIYLGPSLPVELARQALPDATYLPPIAMGDLYSLVENQQPKSVGIIDGFFEQKAAVWHKEILYALSKGVRVYGASSMGALRAAELHAFGMVGVGRVFEAYAGGELEDDDEVTVAHGPAADGFRVVSEAMVNVRHALREAQQRGLVSEGSALALVRMAKETFYIERAWGRLWREAAEAGLAADEIARLRAFVREEKPNLKRDDALALLRRMAKDRDAIAPPLAEIRFEQTSFWRQLVLHVSHAGRGATLEDATVSVEAIWSHTNLLAEREDIFRSCLVACLLTVEARNRGLVVSAEQISRAQEQFRRRRRLLSGAATQRWMEENHISDEDFAELARLDALADEIFGCFGKNSKLFNELLPLELKRRGVFGSVLRDIERKRALRSERRECSPVTATDAEGQILEALIWYQENRRRIIGTLDDHAEELGFENAPELLAEIMVSHQLAKG